jgi:hypothetical protein
MPGQLLSLGVITPLLQNVVYALPVIQCTLFTDTATPALQQSNTSAFTANVALTLTNGQVQVVGGFLRATAVGGANVILKRA